MKLKLMCSSALVVMSASAIAGTNIKPIETEVLNDAKLIEDAGGKMGLCKIDKLSYQDGVLEFKGTDKNQKEFSLVKKIGANASIETVATATDERIRIFRPPLKILTLFKIVGTAALTGCRSFCPRAWSRYLELDSRQASDTNH
jgi:hypothetical protein